MANRNRLFWNLVKGIAIFLMLWTHCIQYCAMECFDFFENAVFKTVYSFHMPLFMLTSGYLFEASFRKRDLKTLLVHRVQGMLQPIVFATLLNNLLMKLPTYVLSGTFSLFDGSLFNGMLSMMWFLWCVLSGSLVVGTVFKLTESALLRAVGAVLGFFVVALFPDGDMHMFMYPFFVTGFLCARHKEKLANLFARLKYISLAVFPVLLLFYENKHYIYLTPMYSPELGLAGSLAIDLFRVLIGLWGSAFVLTLTDMICRRTAKREKLPGILAGISWLGEHSLQIYCLSVPLLSGYLPHVYRKVMELFGGNLPAQNMGVYNFVFTPVLAVCYCVGLGWIIAILKKCKVHAVMFGR